MQLLWLVESWEKKESRLLSEHNEQVSQLSDQLHDRDLQIKQYETDLQVSCLCLRVVCVLGRPTG